MTPDAYPSARAARAYYNEHDPFAAAWLRELIRAGEIAPGDVDERSIEDVIPADLAGYTQCHFFAGIGVWSYALRCAGWPDDRPVWTGSCPCQPFSSAGQGKGFADERHLWPAFHHLIAVCGPDVVFGEQVAGKNGLAWLDLVASDLEAVGYACGAVPFPAAGVGAPHIRERLYWLAHAPASGWAGQRGGRGAQDQRITECGQTGWLADCTGARSLSSAYPGIHSGQEGTWSRHGELERSGAASGLEHTTGDGWQQRRTEPSGRGAVGGCGPDRSGPVNGIWRDADWLGCRDDRWRPVEPGSFPLAHGSAARVGRLRGYGNGLVAPQAQAFIESYIDVTAARQWTDAAGVRDA